MYSDVYMYILYMVIYTYILYIVMHTYILVYTNVRKSIIVFAGNWTLIVSPALIFPVLSGVNFTVVFENSDRVLILYAKFFGNDANSIIYCFSFYYHKRPYIVMYTSIHNNIYYT